MEAYLEEFALFTIIYVCMMFACMKNVQSFFSAEFQLSSVENDFI